MRKQIEAVSKQKESTLSRAAISQAIASDENDVDEGRPTYIRTYGQYREAEKSEQLNWENRLDGNGETIRSTG